MKVSIVTVSFNSEATIRDAIESVLTQSYTDIEYIIVDGQSTDNTVNVVQEYEGRITKFITEPDKGIYDAMNKGVALATGDIIGILNSDDFYRSNEVIEEIVAFYQKTPEMSMVLGGVEFVSEKNLTRVVRVYKAIGFKPWKLRFGFMPPHPGSFIRREVYEKIGVYKINYKIGADFDFFVRSLLISKLRYKTINQNMVVMRVGGVSTSGFKSYKVSTQEMLRSFKENGLHTNFIFLLIRFPIKVLQLISKKYK